MPKKCQIRRLPTKKYLGWSEDGQVFTCDGKDFTLMPNLRTKCTDTPPENTPESL